LSGDLNSFVEGGRVRFDDKMEVTSFKDAKPVVKGNGNATYSYNANIVKKELILPTIVKKELPEIVKTPVKQLKFKKEKKNESDESD